MGWKVELKIQNDSGFDLETYSHWFDSGGEFPKIPNNISNGSTGKVIAVKSPGYSAVSGYVMYTISDKVITFAFSNPVVGTNKLGVGLTGKSVWEDMGDHDYKEFTVEIVFGSTKLYAKCKASGGDTNNATVHLIVHQ